LHPGEDETVGWLDSREGPRGYSRILIQPRLKTFVATEPGLFDYSLAANAVAFIPLWRGAEATVSYLSNAKDSANVHSGIFDYAHIRSGIDSAALHQTFWVGHRILNVTSVGKFEYDFKGFQNETTVFVPWRDDQITVRYSRITWSSLYNKLREVNSGAYYRWNDASRGIWVEGGYSQYVGNDRGPSIEVGRWFGDVGFQVYLKKGGRTVVGGFQLSIPLTPREGMRPGWSHLEGTGFFRHGLETTVAHSGDCNCIDPNVLKEIPMTYGSRDYLLNEGRIGQDYVISQLPRMREAAIRYAQVD
jgi:hypothetical protein